MTRINSDYPPQDLCDQHLVAEYREIVRIGTILEKRIARGADLTAGIPDEFTLGKGHVSFFLDKGLFVEKRFKALKQEMIDRGMRPTMFWRDSWATVPHLRNDWKADAKADRLIRDRIAVKMPPKPRWSQKKIA